MRRKTYISFLIPLPPFDSRNPNSLHQQGWWQHLPTHALALQCPPSCLQSANTIAPHLALSSLQHLRGSSLRSQTCPETGRASHQQSKRGSGLRPTVIAFRCCRLSLTVPGDRWKSMPPSARDSSQACRSSANAFLSSFATPQPCRSARPNRQLVHTKYAQAHPNTSCLSSYPQQPLS